MLVIPLGAVSHLLHRRTTPKPTAGASPFRVLRGTCEQEAVPEGELKVIGIGSRGISAVEHLLESRSVAGADVWCIDNDRKALDKSGVPKKLLVSKDADAGVATPPATLGSGQLTQLLGGAVAEDPAVCGMPSQHSKAVTGDGGVAFVLASAGSWVSTELMLQLVQALQGRGLFVAVAITKPFEFESARVKSLAMETISAMETAAHMVVVVEQNALIEHGAELPGMTMAQASDIADNTLLHTVRSILMALRAPEILRSSRGALCWHGRDLRHYRRLLSPPLQRLLTCPGTGVLGRGLSNIKRSSVAALGLQEVLRRLAFDAVQAVATSPFLQGKLGNATAVLCIVMMPSVTSLLPEDEHAGAGSAAAAADTEKFLARIAVQSATCQLAQVVGPHCHDTVVCAHQRQPSAGDAQAAAVGMEVTLLVLSTASSAAAATPVASGSGSAAATRDGHSPGQGPARGMAARHSGADTPLAAERGHEPTAAAGDSEPSSRPARPGPAPRSSWKAMSAIAGGGAAADDEAPGLDDQEPQVWGTAAAEPGSAGTRSVPPPPGPMPGPRELSSRMLRSNPCRREPQSYHFRPAVAADGGSTAPPSGRKAAGAVETLTAHSLDLPPAAAEWRMKMSKRGVLRRRQPQPNDMPEEIDYIWEEPDRQDHGSLRLSGLRSLLQFRETREVSLRDRVSGLLENDRSDWFDVGA